MLDANPHARDERMLHEAMPVTSGTKYAANYWIHLYPYRSPYMRWLHRTSVATRENWR